MQNEIIETSNNEINTIKLIDNSFILKSEFNEKEMPYQTDIGKKYSKIHCDIVQRVHRLKSDEWLDDFNELEKVCYDAIMGHIPLFPNYKKNNKYTYYSSTHLMEIIKDLNEQFDYSQMDDFYNLIIEMVQDWPDHTKVEKKLLKLLKNPLDQEEIEFYKIQERIEDAIDWINSYFEEYQIEFDESLVYKVKQAEMNYIKESAFVTWASKDVIKTENERIQKQKEKEEKERQIKLEKKLKQKQTYLIKNKNNGKYKIGHSKNPGQRENTLQSAEPDIEIVKTWPYNIERLLHETYDKYRIRGEWFELTPIQIKFICTNNWLENKNSNKFFKIS